MELHKVIDNDFIQVYHIKNPSAEWKKKYKKSTVVVSYNPDYQTVKTRNINKIFDWGIMSDLSYIFTTEPKQMIKNAFKNIPLQNSVPVNKKCGFNATKPEAFSDEFDVMMTAFSMDNVEYSPLMLFESFTIASTKEELNKCGDKLMSTVNKIAKSHLPKKMTFVEFIPALAKTFPLNYMITLRKFYKVITEKHLDPKTNVKDVDFYIGFDSRHGTTLTENELSKQMESRIYKPNDIIHVYETYNNPMDKIQKSCKEKNIDFVIVHKHCISMKYKDYCNLPLVSRISNFV